MHCPKRISTRSRGTTALRLTIRVEIINPGGQRRAHQASRITRAHGQHPIEAPSLLRRVKSSNPGKERGGGGCGWGAGCLGVCRELLAWLIAGRLGRTEDVFVADGDLSGVSECKE